LVLDRRDVAPAALGGEAEATRLGWNGWFKSRDIWSDARDTAYLISAGGAF
jgi:predicted component of type VI protein secretion system